MSYSSSFENSEDRNFDHEEEEEEEEAADPDDVIDVIEVIDGIEEDPDVIDVIDVIEKSLSSLRSFIDGDVDSVQKILSSSYRTRSLERESMWFGTDADTAVVITVATETKRMALRIP